jgi:hypothetical protein
MTNTTKCLDEYTRSRLVSKLSAGRVARVTHLIDSQVVNSGMTIDTLMGESHLASVYRKRICGYCAMDMKLWQVTDFGWDIAEWAHIDADGSMYPCAVADDAREAYITDKAAQIASDETRYLQAADSAKAAMLQTWIEYNARYEAGLHEVENILIP